MKAIHIAALVAQLAIAILPCTAAAAGSPQTSPARLEALKSDALSGVEELKDLTQQMVDMVFSFGELGFQEFETSKYLIGILRKNGFTVQEGISGIPTAWIASWGTGKPVIALGSDIDCLPQANQKPGLPYREAFVDGAPGHGEGHNSGVPLNITAALAVKRLMEKEHLAGTIRLWPGVAEELVATKAYYARDGFFKDVDVVLFNHVASNMNTSYGAAQATGLVSVEYNFKGESSHAAASPWQGKSALDAVELMDIGWNFRREHFRLQQRSHYVITNGGDQPNVVPSTASVWYYFRETEYQRIKDLFELGNTMARAAAMMTDTSVSWRILGSAWPQHFSKPVAEVMYENIKKVGLPKWSEDDHALAKAVQREIKIKETGLSTEIPKMGLPVLEQDQRGGGSDDIGDVSWCVPTVTLRFPSNIPGLPSHNWVSAIAMATPIAHKGATTGAKVMAATLLDLLMKPELVEQAWDYFRNVQSKDLKYQPLVGPEDKPAIDLNRKIMDRYRPEMRKYYFDSARYRTYLEQLGIPYPAVKKQTAPAK